MLGIQGDGVKSDAPWSQSQGDEGNSEYAVNQPQRVSVEGEMPGRLTVWLELLVQQRGRCSMVVVGVAAASPHCV